jgi:hypothetical protein
MLTAAVISYRLYLTGGDKYPQEPRSIEELIQSSDVFEDDCPDVDAGDGDGDGDDDGDCIDKSSEILSQLSQLERLIVHEHDVPAFEMLGHGSFIEYLHAGTSLGPKALYSLMRQNDMTVQLETSDAVEDSLPESSQSEIATAILGAINDMMTSSHVHSNNDILDVMCSIEDGVCAALGSEHFYTLSGGLSVDKYLSNLRRIDEAGESCDDIADTVLAFSKIISNFSTSFNPTFDHDGDSESRVIDEQCEDHKEFCHQESDDFLNFKLLFPVEVTADEEVSHGSDIENARNLMRNLLLKVPLGVSCVEYLMWDTVLRSHEMPTNLLDFVVEEKLALTSDRAEVSYVAICATDVVAVCSSLPTLFELRQDMAARKWSAIASCCLAATVEVIDKIEMQALFHAEFRSKLENSGLQGISILLDLCVNISLSTAKEVQGIVLAFIIETIAKCCDISVDTVQEKLVEHVLREEGEQEGRGGGLHCSQLWRLVRAACLHSSDKRLAAIACFRTIIYEGDSVVTSEYNAELELESSVAIVDGEHVESSTSPRDLFHDSEANFTTAAAGDIESLSVVKGDGAESSCSKEDPRAAIERLLRSDFGYSEAGVRPSEDSPVTVKLRNALEHLSRSLYSSDVHFVSELVQNADDNSYDDGLKPTLLIQLYSHAVVIYNNEVGFSESNIIAICNVGGSTKKNQTGYIGQKGIG